MIYFSLEDYFFNITPLKRWVFLIIIILISAILQYKRFANNYLDQKLAQQKILSQQKLLNELKNILAKKNTMIEYCDFYKLDYAELKILLAQMVNSNNYIKSMILEPDLGSNKEKILVHLDFDS